MPNRLSSKPDKGLDTNANDAMRQKMLTEGNIRMRKYRHLSGLLPTNPRGVNCHKPFAGIGGSFLQFVQGKRGSAKNPRFCAGCHAFTTRCPVGAEIELTMLFVDVRGSTSIAETMDVTEFSQLMNRFYEATIRVLVQADALIGKLVGDEVTALFIPGFAGKYHAQRAIGAGQTILQATGYGGKNGPWIPIGVGSILVKHGLDLL